MKTAVVACPTIRDELLLAHSFVQGDYDIVWIEKNLHSFPKKLNKELQYKLDTLTEYDRVILAFGFCGNAVANLRAGQFELIIPRIDDCISMMLGSYSLRKAMVDTSPAIFMTRGWVEGEKAAWEEYNHVCKRHGDDAQDVFALMYGMHKDLVVLDTGAYSLSNILDKTEILAQAYGLQHKIYSAGVAYLEQILSGPWEEPDFLHIQPGGMVEENMLTL